MSTPSRRIPAHPTPRQGSLPSPPEPCSNSPVHGASREFRLTCGNFFWPSNLAGTVFLLLSPLASASVAPDAPGAAGMSDSVALVSLLVLGLFLFLSRIAARFLAKSD
jgi:hypothetical protein